MLAILLTRAVLTAWLLSMLLTVCGGCSDPQSPEAQVRAVIDALQGMAGRPLEAGAWELATRVEELDLVLRQTSGEWRVLYATRR